MPHLPWFGNVTFIQPQFLLLLLLIPLLWRVAGARLRSVPAGQRRTALSVRSLILILLVAAIAEPALRIHRPSLEVVFALDHSRSLNEDQQAWFQQWIKGAAETLDPDDRATSISFDHTVSLGDVNSSDQSPDQDRTNLESALR